MKLPTATPLRAIVPAWDGAPRGPEAGPRYVLRREYFGCLVYDRESLEYVPYDAEATALLLARADRPQPATDDEGPFLAAMQAEGVLDAEGVLTARVVADRSAPDRLSAPLTVYLGALQGCNLACTHCQSDSGPGPLGLLPIAIVRRLFAELRDLGCGLVHLTGGEPLLHPALLEAADEAFRWGLNVLLTTNGTLITERLADELGRRPFRCVSVSVDGATADTNDLIRGAGAFEQTLTGLKRLAARRPVGITATYTPSLRGQLPALAALCETIGAASLTLRPALPSGRAVGRDELLPTQAEFEEACAELDRLQVEARIPLFHPPKVPHQETSAFVLERFGCVAGNLVCSVNPTGEVNPCSLLGPSFDSGSLRDHTLHELWAGGETFLKLRALEGNTDCWSCRHYDHCGGGCRARALADGRDANDPDPWCTYEPIEGGRR